MKKNTVLITGGAGYIGSHTNLLFKERGYDTVVLDNLIYGHKESVLGGSFIKGDISDVALLDKIFSEYENPGCRIGEGEAHAQEVKI